MLAADRWLPKIAAWTDPCFGRWFGLSVVAIATARAVTNTQQTQPLGEPSFIAS
jgi:hypothetical protein